MMKNAFYFILEAFLFSRYLIVLPDIFSHERTRLGRKAKVYFKIYDITNWEKDNFNTHIAQWLKKRQSDNEIWSGFRI